MPQPFADQFRSMAMSANLAGSLERAHEFAREQGHRAVTLEHLLLAFTEDPDASAVLQASNIDLVRLGTDVSGYLGRLLEDMRGMDGAEPQTDPELMRVLHAAVQAAQQSRRRQIDGAIVLAAVVGDGKSPAAGLLKAHGMTFEEAIRALQKANAKASALARSKQFATPPPPAGPAAAPPQAPLPAADLHTPSPEQGDAGTSEAPSQSVEEILAAARARIQQRTGASAIGKAPDAVPEAPHARPPEPPQLSASSRPDVAPAQDKLSQPQAAPEEPAAAQVSEPPPPGAPQLKPSARTTWAPPASPDRTAPSPGRPPQPPQHRPSAPFSQRPVHAGEGPPRPPLPSRGSGPGAPPLPTLPGRGARPPWPPTDEPPALNGAHAEAPVAIPRRPAQRTGGQPGQGPLVETIPRRMRVGVAATAQVRISRDRIDTLILLLMKGRGLALRPEALASRSLSVRLMAPDGGFWIEAASPETQWAELVPGGHQHDDQLTWRWTVTPQYRGRHRLVLVVTARTVAQDGLAAEAAPPDRVIEVTVAGGRMRRTARWIGYVAMLSAGALVGRFGGELWAIGAAVIRRVLG